MNAISQFNNMILSQTVVNEHHIPTVVFQAFRSISLTKSISMNSNIHVQVPSTLMEEYNHNNNDNNNNINTSSISIIQNHHHLYLRIIQYLFI